MQCAIVGNGYTRMARIKLVGSSSYPWLVMEFNGKRFNNNGQIRLSVRQAALKMGISKDTAARVFRDLQAKGLGL